MAKSSGGTRVGSASVGGGRNSAIPNSAEAIQAVKQALMSYSATDRWNNNTAYSLGFNDQAQAAIQKLADGNYGFPSDVAKTVTGRNGWKDRGAKVSEKQAYHLAKGIVENGLVKNDGIFRVQNSAEKAELAFQEAWRKQRRHDRRERQKARRAGEQIVKKYLPSEHSNSAK